MFRKSTNRRRRRRALSLKKEGEAAALAGQPMDSNPYGSMDDWRYIHWSAGYFYGYRSMQEKKLKEAA